MYRPVGVAVGPDGAIYVTDDKRGRVWRIQAIQSEGAPADRTTTSD
jgi:glucose/arabinose dehydrogenase